uniref:Tropomyosin n=1 Tax=Panagrolaimus sp. PS1159 TaxID=55785 RepID=A0AC35FJA2_9BILA
MCEPFFYSKIVELEEELRVVGNNLKSLEVSEEKALQREDAYEEQIRNLSARLKEAETRAEFAERSVQKLQKEVDRLEDELLVEKERVRNLTAEIEQTVQEIQATYTIISQPTSHLYKMPSVIVPVSAFLNVF